MRDYLVEVELIWVGMRVGGGMGEGALLLNVKRLNDGASLQINAFFFFYFTKGAFLFVVLHTFFSVASVALCYTSFLSFLKQI